MTEKPGSDQPTKGESSDTIDALTDEMLAALNTAVILPDRREGGEILVPRPNLDPHGVRSGRASAPLVPDPTASRP